MFINSHFNNLANFRFFQNMMHVLNIFLLKTSGLFMLQGSDMYLPDDFNNECLDINESSS